MNRRLLYFFYFLSGLAALVYEIVWAGRLGLIFGVDAYGVATVLSVFFTGLALGSFVFGRFVGNRRFPLIGKQMSPLLLYGVLEVGIGLYAALTPFLFKEVTSLQTYFYSVLADPQFFSFSLITFALSILVLIVPTILMGGTFPAVVEAASQIGAEKGRINADRGIGGTAGLLYGVNTLGAVLGTLLAGFLLIYLVGMNVTTWLAAGVSLIVGVIAIWLSRISTDKGRISTDIRAHRQPIRAHQRAILIALGLAGFAALALEVLWSRVLILTFGGSIYAFATILATFLLGIALGSILISRLLTRIRANSERMLTNERMVIWLAWSLTALGILVVFLTPVLGNLPSYMLGLLDPASFSYKQVLGATFALSFLALLLPTGLMGANFVLALQVYTRMGTNPSKSPGQVKRILTNERIGLKVGIVYSINTLGGVLGALTAGFVLLPLFGIQKSIVFAASFYLLAAILISFVLLREKERFKKGVVIASVLALIIGIVLPSWKKDLLVSGVYIYFPEIFLRDDIEKYTSEKELVFYKEGILLTVSVKKSPSGALLLSSNGKVEVNTDHDIDANFLIGHLPMILHPNPRNVAMVGLGSGISFGAMNTHDTDYIEVVEIEDSIIEAAQYFKDFNHGVSDDPDISIIKADARGYFSANERIYDVIASQPSNPWVKGNVNLYTKEFFDIVSSKLEKDGIMLAWFQFSALSNSDFKSALATFHSVFPYVTVWTPVVSHDLLLVGSKTPQEFDFEVVKEKIEQDEVVNDLKIAAITSAETLLGHYLFDEKGIEELTRGAQIISDDKPTLEYSAPFSLNQDTSTENLKDLLSISGDFTDHFKNLDKANGVEINKMKHAVDLILGAEIKLGEGKVKEAADDYEEALILFEKEEAKKELARIYFELAKASYEKENIASTISYFEKSVDNLPNAQVYLNLSIMYLRQGRLFKAEDALGKAKELEPDNPRIEEIEQAVTQQ